MANPNPAASEKNALVAYFWWFFGGWLGLHHFYLGRDNHGVLTACISPVLLITYPAWFFSWLRDFFNLNDYVALRNGPAISHRAKEMDRIKKDRISANEKPPWSWARCFAAWFYAWIFQLAFSNIKLLSYFSDGDFSMVDNALGLAGVVLGASMVVWIDPEKSDNRFIFAAAIMGKLFQNDEVFFMNAPVMAAAVATWKRSYKQDSELQAAQKARRGFVGTVTANGIKVGFLMSLLVFAGITSIQVESNGEQIELREAIKNALRSEGFQEFVTLFQKFTQDWQDKGFEESFNDFANSLKDAFDVDGEDHAYKVLGLKQGATIQEVKKAHRKLALQNHPDKGGDADKFREIQEAYETLDKILKIKQKSRGGGG